MKLESSFSIDTDKAAQNMRQRVKLINKVLIANLANSFEEMDSYTKPNCNGFGRIRIYKNYLFHVENSQNSAAPNRGAFISGLDSSEGLRTQVFQLSGCSWQCWYCYVDNTRLSGNQKYGQFFPANELIDLYLDQNDPPKVIDLSGGQPDLVPEWPLWIMSELDKRELIQHIFIRSEDNLSNEYLWKYLSKSEINWIAENPRYSRIGCFKGFDEESFAFNTGAKGSLFNRQFDIFNRLHKDHFNLYAYTTFTSPSNVDVKQKIQIFIERLQKIHHNYPLRIVPLMVTPNSANLQRKTKTNFSKKQDQVSVWEVWNEELQKKFNSSELATPFSEVILT